MGSELWCINKADYSDASTNTLVSSESFLFLTCLDKQSAQPFQVVLWIHIAVLIFYMEATTMSNKNHLVWITCCLDKFYQWVITRILKIRQFKYNNYQNAGYTSKINPSAFNCSPLPLLVFHAVIFVTVGLQIITF